MSENVVTLPGPFNIQRVIEFEGPFIAPDHLFPTSTPAQIKATKTFHDPRFFDSENNLLVMSFHSIVVRTPSHTILVDTCIGNDKPRPRMDLWHQRRGSYLDDLAGAGMAADEIDIVMCTHLHADHVGWNTKLENGQWVPTFPNAKYLFAQKEVDYWQQVLERETPSEVNHDSWADSVAPILEAGQAVLVGMDHEISAGVSLVPAPGHTPGNVMVLLEERGERAYVLGDTIHHPLQLEHPEWSTRFCWDADLSRATRTKTLSRAVDENAWLIPAHFATPTASKIRRASEGFALSE